MRLSMPGAIDKCCASSQVPLLLLNVSTSIFWWPDLQHQIVWVQMVQSRFGGPLWPLALDTTGEGAKVFLTEPEHSTWRWYELIIHTHCSSLLCVSWVALKYAKGFYLYSIRADSHLRPCILSSIIGPGWPAHIFRMAISKQFQEWTSSCFF